jgi:hypothetical protein
VPPRSGGKLALRAQSLQAIIYANPNRIVTGIYRFSESAAMFRVASGCGGKPAGCGRSPKNRMNDDVFSPISARIVEFIPRAAALPASATDDEFNQLARALFALQVEHVPVYQRLCRARQVLPADVQSWREFPAVPTAAFKDFEVTSLPPTARTRVFYSSGTTAQRPSRHFHDAASLAVYEASLRPWLAMHLMPEFRGREENPLRLFALTPPPGAVPNSSLVHMFDVVARACGTAEPEFLADVGADGAWLLRWAAAMTALREAASAGRPVCLLGTAFSFVHLLDHLEAAGVRLALPVGSRALETGGYKGRSRVVPKADLHAAITRRLGVPATHLICEYGMSELGSQAYDGVAGAPPAAGGRRVFRFPPWARARVVSPETGRDVADGETGLLRVVDLANVRSVMAIQTEDLAVRRGDGFELAGRVPQAAPRGCSLMPA